MSHPVGGLPLNERVEVGPISAERGTKAYGFLSVATSANGGELGIGVHILAGSNPGPKIVLMSGSHGNELVSVAAVKKVIDSIDCTAMTGDLIAIPLQNPIAFEMGARGTWIDGVWGDAGNLNRLWPGRANGWLTERFTHTIVTKAFPGATVIMDLHCGRPGRRLSYGYLGVGQTGDLDYDIARVFGQEMLVWNSPEALREKNQTTSTAQAAARRLGFASYAGEEGDFYGLEGERASAPEGSTFRSGTDIGFTGVTNVMKHLGMIDGEPSLPKRQISVTPELNLRSNHGGLLVTHVGMEALGTVLPKGTPLGTVLSAHSFEVLDEIVAPFDETLLIATCHHKPWTKVHPGEFTHIVADNKLTEELP
jgi:predicted deacylase